MKDFFKIQEGFEFRLYGLDSNDEMIGQTVDIDDLYKAFLARMIDDGFIEANPKRWVRPTKSEIGDYFCEKRAALDDAVKFFDYWDSLDWKVKNTRIKSWKGRANTWIKNNEKYKRNDSQRFNGESAADKIAASIANRNR